MGYPEKSVRMLQTVEDANEHIVFDEDGTPKMEGGTVVKEHVVDTLIEGRSYPLPVWQANHLIELGYAEAI